MHFRSLSFHNFRNLKESLIPTDSKHVILLGNNGQGKTNFLEAIYLLCYGSSFRAANIKELCTHGKKDFSLSAVVSNDQMENQHLLLRYSDGKREIRIDGKEIKDRRDLIYNIPCIVFSHDDIEFVRGAPESRRKFFDQTMSLYDPLFLDDLRRYRSVLRQRNAAIKASLTTLLPIYNRQLAELGINIQIKREKEVKQFNQLFGSLYTKVAQTEDKMSINYRPSWHGCTKVDEVVEKLERNIETDFKMQTTTSGIHRDQFIVMQNKVNFSQSGSTGQMRLASLIFRVAQIETYLQHSDKEPILLIDDVLLELDLTKRALFLDLLTGYSQAFFTFLPQESYFAKIESEISLTYKVEDGNFIKE
jgi:DNA replication and repair protein RecF